MAGRVRSLESAGSPTFRHSVKNILEHASGSRGAQSRKWLTLRDLIGLGVVSVNADFSLKNRTPPKSYTAFDNTWYTDSHASGSVSEEIFRSPAFPGFSGVHPVYGMVQFYYWTDGGYTGLRFSVFADSGGGADTFLTQGGASSRPQYAGGASGTRTPCSFSFSFELGTLIEDRGGQIPDKGIEFYVKHLASGSSSANIEYGLIRWFVTECDSRLSLYNYLFG